jgi:DNA-binding HxlR family transcriptional regulator
MKKQNSDQTFQRQQFEPDPDGITRKPSVLSEYQKDKLVLRELNKGIKTFEKIQKNTNFERNELNSIFDSLEKRGLMEVKQKSGLFGPKVELYVTEKGFKEYHS